MREDLKLWAESNLLDLRKTGPHTYECGGQSFLLLEEKDGYICDQDFDLILDDREKSESKKVDWLLYKWGSKFYYTSPEEIDNLSDDNLKPFRYIGEALCTKPGYPMIGVHGMYELLNGTCDYDQWTAKAKFLGIDTLGICERNTLAGTLLFQQECAKAGLKSILGETIIIHTDKDEFLEAKVFALNKKGWKNLLLINAEINVVNSTWIAESRLLELGRNLALVADPLMMPYDSSRMIRYSKSFEKLYFKIDTVVWDSDDTDKKFLEETQRYLSAGISPVIICDAYYLDKGDFEVKQDLNTIAGTKNRLSENQYFKCDDENMEALSSLFQDGDFEDVIGLAYQNLDSLCSSIDFKIETGKFKLPQYRMTEEEASKYATNEELFDSLIVQGFENKGILEYDNCEEYLARIEIEADVIKYGGFIDYFLVLHDIIRWCNNNNILVGFGRGSAAGCLISYLLGIVKIDPLKYDLLFERFLTKERAKKSLPDIDTDFEANRRDDVKAYMIERYGEDHMCSLGTYTSLQMKALLKDFCRIKGVPIQQAEYLSAIIDDTKDNSNMRASRAPWEYIFKLATRSKVLFDFIQNHPSMIEEMRLCYAQPRSASVHACATLILPNDENLYTSIPVRKGILKGKEMIVTEWEGSEIEVAGYLKEDILGIQQLDKFRMIINLVEDNYGKRVDIYSLPLDEREVYKMFGQGLNGDVFHLGSKGLTSYCVQLQPQNIDDLIAALALYRPGPMDNNFHHEYILRKSGKKRFDYQPGLEDITKKTYGLLVYQEQVMQACVNIASFSLSEADDVRKGMAKSKKKFLEEQGTKFIERGVKNGYEEPYLEDLWHQMCMFGRYGFNKSHAACYAITGYTCEYLKWKYPLPYWITALQFAGSGSEDMLRFISEINRAGKIKLAPPDINKSQTEFYADFHDQRIFWSISKVKQCGDVATKFIFDERGANGEFYSLDEFLSRVDRSKVNKSVIENLILAGAFDEIEGIRTPVDRARLIERYRDIGEVKIQKNAHDWYRIAVNNGHAAEDWWWLLQQKRVCGLAFFDFREILWDKVDIGMEKYISAEDFINQDLSSSRTGKVLVTGIINDIERKSGNKGEYVRIRLEENYSFVWVTIWSEYYEKLKDVLTDDARGKIAAVYARGFFDSYRNENALQSDTGFQIKFLNN